MEVMRMSFIARARPEDERGNGNPTLRSEFLRAGAGEGNRTLVCSLGSCRSTIELRPPIRQLNHKLTLVFIESAWCHFSATSSRPRDHSGPAAEIKVPNRLAAIGSAMPSGFDHGWQTQNYRQAEARTILTAARSEETSNSLARGTPNGSAYQAQCCETSARPCTYKPGCLM